MCWLEPGNSKQCRERFPSLSGYLGSGLEAPGLEDKGAGGGGTGSNAPLVKTLSREHCVNRWHGGSVLAVCGDCPEARMDVS